MTLARTVIHGTMLLSIAGAVGAQEPARPPAPSPTPIAPSASGAPDAAGSAAPPIASDVEAELAAKAYAAFQRGDAQFAAGDFEQALTEYTRAYELVPDHKPLYNIGSANVRLSRWAAARRAFSLYLELGAGQVSAERIEQVHRFLEALRKKTATLNLTLNVADAEVHIDGERVSPTEFTGLVLEPGEHVVRVTKPGFRPFEQVLHAADGQDVRLVLPLARNGPIEAVPVATPLAPAVPPPQAIEEPTPLWVPWTVTTLLAAGWATTAGLAIKARHDRDVIEQPSTSPQRIDAARNLHVTLAVVSDVLLASTLASAGISAYLTWWPSAPEPSARSPRPGALAIGVSGHF